MKEEDFEDMEILENCAHKKLTLSVPSAVEAQCYDMMFMLFASDDPESLPLEQVCLSRRKSYIYGSDLYVGELPLPEPGLYYMRLVGLDGKPGEFYFCRSYAKTTSSVDKKTTFHVFWVETWEYYPTEKMQEKERTAKERREARESEEELLGKKDEPENYNPQIERALQTMSPGDLYYTAFNLSLTEYRSLPPDQLLVALVPVLSEYVSLSSPSDLSHVLQSWKVSLCPMSDIGGDVFLAVNKFKKNFPQLVTICNGLDSAMGYMKSSLKEQTIKIMVMGEGNSGKSSLINALCGFDLLPAKQTTCTITLWHIKYGDRKKVFILKNGQKKNITHEVGLLQSDESPGPKVAKYVKNEMKTSQWFKRRKKEDKKKGGKSKESKEEMVCLDPILIEWPIPLLEPGIEIIDTPGFGDFPELDQMVKSHLNSADAYIYVVGGDHNLPPSRMAHFKEIQEVGHKKLFVVHSKLDLSQNEEDKREIQQKLLKQLMEATDGGFVISNYCCCNLRKALEPPLQNSDMWVRADFGSLISKVCKFIEESLAMKRFEVYNRGLLDPLETMKRQCIEFRVEAQKNHVQREKQEQVIDNFREWLNDCEAHCASWLAENHLDNLLVNSKKNFSDFLMNEATRMETEAAEWKWPSKGVFVQRFLTRLNNRILGRIKSEKLAVLEYLYAKAVEYLHDKGLTAQIQMVDAIYEKKITHTWNSDGLNVEAVEAGTSPLEGFYWNRAFLPAVYTGFSQFIGGAAGLVSIPFMSAYAVPKTIFQTRERSFFSHFGETAMSGMKYGIEYGDEADRESSGRKSERMAKAMASYVRKNNEQIADNMKEELVCAPVSQESGQHEWGLPQHLVNFVLKRLRYDLNCTIEMETQVKKKLLKHSEKMETLLKMSEEIVNEDGGLQHLLGILNQGVSPEIWLSPFLLDREKVSVNVDEVLFSVGEERYFPGKIDTGYTTNIIAREIDNDVSSSSEVAGFLGINHPNVVRFYGLAAVDKTVYYVVDKPKMLLTDFLKKNQDIDGELLPFPVVFSMVQDIVRGIKALHDKGIVHRGLSCDSVFVMAVPDESSSNSAPFLALASLNSSRPVQWSGTTSAKGKERMDNVIHAPEQQHQLHRFTDDVFFFGLIAWQILNLHSSPVEAILNQLGEDSNYFEEYSGPFEVVQQALKTGFVPKHTDEARKLYGDSFCDLVSKCMSHHPSERPSMAAVSFELLTLLDGIHAPICEVPKRGLRVLTMDGGGTRGIVLAEMLKMLETHTKHRICEMFDVICGTSTGGIMALALTGANKSAVQCQSLYMRLSEQIFGPSGGMGTLSTALNFVLNKGHYQQGPLMQMLDQEFLGKDGCPLTMNSIKKPLVFVVTKKVSDPRPYILRSYEIPASNIPLSWPGDSSWEMWEASMATSAAPAFFPPFKNRGHKFIDGGVGFNNPAEIALDELRAMGHTVDFVVSLGTGSAPHATNGRDHLLEQVTNPEVVDSKMQNLAAERGFDYYRFQPELGSLGNSLDNGSQEALKEMQVITHRWLANAKKEDFQLVVNRLTSVDSEE